MQYRIHYITIYIKYLGYYRDESQYYSLLKKKKELFTIYKQKPVGTKLLK